MPRQTTNNAREVKSDGALNWAPDFATEEAGFIVSELIRGSSRATRQATADRLLESLAARTPDWTEMLRRVTTECAKI